MTRLSQSDFDMLRRNAPLVSIDFVIENNDGRVLVGKRANDPAREMWFVPGGRVLKDEYLDDAFRRLLKAELGESQELCPEKRSDAQFLGVYEHHYPAQENTQSGFSIHYIVLGYRIRARTTSSNVLPRSQHDRWEWMTKRELLTSKDVHENTKAYVR